MARFKLSKSRAVHLNQVVNELITTVLVSSQQDNTIGVICFSNMTQGRNHMVQEGVQITLHSNTTSDIYQQGKIRQIYGTPN